MITPEDIQNLTEALVPALIEQLKPALIEELKAEFPVLTVAQEHIRVTDPGGSPYRDRGFGPVAQDPTLGGPPETV